MSKKPKYKADESDLTVRNWQGILTCACGSMAMARKIARALNAMEDKPKAKPFVFDWSLPESRYNFAAMDLDGAWYLFEVQPRTDGDELWMCGGNFREIRGIKPYPGDWRNSLQKRP